MSKEKDVFPEFDKNGYLYPAYCVLGDGKKVFSKISDFIEKKFKMSASFHPDIVFEEKDIFAIDDARSAKNKSIMSSFSGGKRFFIFSFRVITREAQNSLLKFLEEPSLETHIFLITDNIDGIIPTLKSRLFILSLGGGEASFGKEFLEMKPAERISFVTKFSEDKDKDSALALLDSVEREICNLKKASESFDSLLEIEMARSFLKDRSPSVKLLMEHISLVLPAFSEINKIK